MHFLADLVATLGIEQRVEPRTRADAHVMRCTSDTPCSVLLELVAVQHRLAARALGPQALGNDLARRALFALDARRKDLVDPAHASLPAPIPVLPRSTFMPPPSTRVERARMPREPALPLTPRRARCGTSTPFPGSAAQPITTASANAPPPAALAASRMPKPTPTGTRVQRADQRQPAATLAMSRCAAPVIPLRLT